MIMKTKANPKQIINRWAFTICKNFPKFTKQNKKFNSLYFKVFSTNTSNKNISLHEPAENMYGRCFCNRKTSLVARFVKLTLISIHTTVGVKIDKKIKARSGGIGNSFCGICTEKTNFKTFGFLLT